MRAARQRFNLHAIEMIERQAAFADRIAFSIAFIT